MRSFAKEEWEKVRAEGKQAFLFKNGFLGRGLPLGAVMAVAVEALRGGAFPDVFATLEFYGLLAFTVAVFTASGCIASNANWALHERRRGES